MRITVSRALAISLFALAAPATAPALAQETGYEHERASIVLGAFITDRNTQTRVDSDSGSGTEIDLEGELGLDETTTVFRFGADLWFAQRQRFDFSIFDLSRTAARRIDETIDFGDTTFVVDTYIESDSNLTITKADYTFAVLDKPKGYFGITGGLYVSETELALSEATLGSTEKAELTAPLPVIGIRGEYGITDRITIRGASQWFSIDTGDASGRLTDVYFGADYSIGRRFAVGLAFNDVSMNIQAEDEGGWVGRIDWSYDGWMAYFKTDFGGGSP